METPNISRTYPSVTGARAHSCRPSRFDSPASRHHAGCEYPRFSHSADRCASSKFCRGDVTCDLVEVGLPRATAPAPDVDVGVLPGQASHALTELRRVAHLEVPECAERNLVHHCGVGSQTTHTLKPVARLDRRHELEWMRAVDA